MPQLLSPARGSLIQGADSLGGAVPCHAGMDNPGVLAVFSRL